MSHFTVRYLIAGTAVAMSVLIGGSAFADRPEPERSPVTAQAVVESAVPPIDPNTLHGEIKNSDPNKKTHTLGANEELVETVGLLVSQIDPRLDYGQVNAIAKRLVFGDAETTGIWQQSSDYYDLDMVEPGVSFTVERIFDGADVSWQILTGKNSGLS